jgi:hypothetical protein
MSNFPLLAPMRIFVKVHGLVAKYPPFRGPSPASGGPFVRVGQTAETGHWITRNHHLEPAIRGMR